MTKEREDRPRARRTDPETSHEAADRVANVKQCRLRIMVILNEEKEGLTHKELIEEFQMRGWNLSHSGVRGRCRELVDSGLVRDSGRCRLSQYNRRMIVWEAVRKT
jgi:hypothetical protein